MEPDASRRRRLLVATRSPHKLAELRTLLDLPNTDLLSLDDVGVAETPAEDHATFSENAVAKAEFYATRARMPTLADDSGLEVEALGAAPGVRSHRYAGPNATDEANNRKLLRELSDVPVERRAARYVCALAFLPEPGDGPVVREGTLAGRIAFDERGSGGFGYDPLFEPEGEPSGGRTVGLLTQEEKNRISHRARAARKMGEYLRARGY